MSAIHIVFGETAGITLKAALNQYAQQEWQADQGCLSFALGAGVLSCMDYFAIGPVFEMDLPTGFFARLAWVGEFLENTMGPEDTLDDVDDVLEAISDFYKRLAWIEEERPVVIWYGDNVVEQFGLRLLSCLLPKHQFYGVNLMRLKQHFYLDDATCCFGDFATEHLLEGVRQIEAVSPAIKALWQKEFKAMASEQSMLRIWENGQVISAPESYYDPTLLAILEAGPISPSRFIGEALLKTPHGIDASFLVKRLQLLAEAGLVSEIIEHYHELKLCLSSWNERC